MGTFWEHLESKTASHVCERRFMYPEPGPNIRNGKQARNRRTEHPTERKKEKRQEIPPIRWLHPPPCSSIRHTLP